MSVTDKTSRPRGRPVNSGEPDDGILFLIEQDLFEDSALSVRKAILNRIPDDTISPESVLRRLERKLKRRRLEQTEREAKGQRVRDLWKKGVHITREDLREVMEDLGLGFPMDTNDIQSAADLNKYFDSKPLLFGIAELNAHDLTFDHPASSYLHRDAETGGVALSSSTGSLEIISPPSTDRFVDRAVLMSWEKGEHAVVMSPEEKEAWDATDGAYWRMMHDWGTPLWRKIIPLWYKPDLSMTEAMRRAANRNAWEAHLRDIAGETIDYDGKLSHELRAPIPASRMVALPERVWNRIKGIADRIWCKLRYGWAIFPSRERAVWLRSYNQVYLGGGQDNITVDSIGEGDHNIHLEFSSNRHSGAARRWDRGWRCEITDRKTGQPVDTDTALDIIENIERALLRFGR